VILQPLTLGAPYVVIDRDPCKTYREYGGSNMDVRNDLAAQCAVWRSDTPACISADRYRQNGSRLIAIQQGLDRSCSAEMPLPVPNGAKIVNNDAPVRSSMVRAAMPQEEDHTGRNVAIGVGIAAVLGAGAFVYLRSRKKR
jgi:hypothetical protein